MGRPLRAEHDPVIEQLKEEQARLRANRADKAPAVRDHKKLDALKARAKEIAQADSDEAKALADTIRVPRQKTEEEKNEALMESLRQESEDVESVRESQEYAFYATPFEKMSPERKRQQFAKIKEKLEKDTGAFKKDHPAYYTALRQFIEDKTPEVAQVSTAVEAKPAPEAKAEESYPAFWRAFEHSRALLSQSDDPRDQSIATLTWEEFNKPQPVKKGFLNRLAKFAYAPSKTDREINEAKIRAALDRNGIDARSKQNPLRGAERLREHNATRLNRLKPGTARQVSETTAQVNAPEKELGTEEGVLPAAAESDAKRNAERARAQLENAPSAETRKNIQRRVSMLEKKNERYLAALSAFDERTTDAFTKGDISATKALVNVRTVFNEMMREIDKNAFRADLRKRLKRSGIESFDDIVIAATNKKRFDRLWKTFTDIQQELSVGGLHAAQDKSGSRPRQKLENYFADRTPSGR